MEPFLLILAPITSSPLSFSTGILSPVNIDSSTEVRPSTTTPSTGILSPGRTRITSPKATSSTVISRSEEHTSELQSRGHLVCRLLLEKKNTATETKETQKRTEMLRYQLKT